MRRATVAQALIVATLICAASALLEGFLAGRGVQSFFVTIRQPRYSLPLRVWYFIGVLYYVMCFVVLSRLFAQQASFGRDGALLLILLMMIVNALWNFVFFRLKDMFMSWIAGLPYGVLAILLFACLLSVDRPAAWVVLPYLVYLCYASIWGYRVWMLNRQ